MNEDIEQEELRAMAWLQRQRRSFCHECRTGGGAHSFGCPHDDYRPEQEAQDEET